jgi:sortase A
VRGVRALVHGLGELCVTLGVLVLLFVAWQLWWTDVAAGQVQRDGVHDLQRAWAAPARTAARTGTAGEVQADEVRVGGLQVDGRQPVPSEAFALLRVPRFGRDYVRPVLEGVGLGVLDDGVGHYPGSALPGAVGNLALAGHRVTYARPFHDIARLRTGDPVVVETKDTWFVYRVESRTVVSPDRVDVVAAVPGRPGVRPTRRMMTMTACNPMYSARERYVVFSRLDRAVPKSTGSLPAELR